MKRAEHRWDGLDSQAFSGLTVVLPVVTETRSLDETVKVLHEHIDPDVQELLIVVCDRTTPASLERCHAASAHFGERVRIHHQRLPFLGGAMRETFDLAKGSHLLMMSSDLETDPATVPEMLKLGKRNPNSIVTASRWREGGSFTGYGQTRVILNWTFQQLVALLYRTDLTDATFGFRLFPTSVLQAIAWKGTKHELLLETALKPLLLGVPILEVATQWKARDDGESQNSLGTQARYLKALVSTRLCRRASLVRAGRGV